MVDVAEVMHIMLANQSTKTIKVKKWEEVGKALLLKSVQRVKFSEEISREQCQEKNEMISPVGKYWVLARNTPKTERS